MDITTLATIVSLTGAAFCFTLAGAIKYERPVPDNSADVLNMFGITPANQHHYMH